MESWLKPNDEGLSTPLPTQKGFVREFLSSEGEEDTKAHEELAQEMGLTYRGGVGEKIFAVVTAHPDVSHATKDSHRTTRSHTGCTTQD